jgi:hypothetical protein
MCFATIAQPFIKLGIPVFPLVPKDKVPPSGLQFLQEATTDPAKVEAWAKENPDYNVALLANGEFCFLEFDIKGGMKAAALEMGQEVPKTLVQKSGRGFGHWIFKHTERSRGLGNRSVNLPNGSGEWFSFRAHNKYLVAAGSTHPNGSQYALAQNLLPAPCPDWVCEFVEKHSLPPKPKPKPKAALTVSDDFDFNDFCDHYGVTISFVKDDVWHVVEECPGVGYRHEQSTLTAFYWDGESLGWSCFAQGCPTSEMAIGELISFLNQSHEPYTGVIWDPEPDADWADRMGIELLEAGDPLLTTATVPKANPDAFLEPGSQHPPVANPPVPPPPSGSLAQGPDGINALTPVEVARILGAEPSRFEVEDMIADDLGVGPDLPAPDSVAIDDPDRNEGMEFPNGLGYGKLRDIARRYPRLQQGWLYHSLLAVASALGIEDRDHNVRSNLYVALVGDVELGKSVCMSTAASSILLPEGTLLDSVPGSDRGLITMLPDNEPSPRLLVVDEGLWLTMKNGIQGSSLPQMLNTLWGKDAAGASDKRGEEKCYAKLSILLNLTCKDPAEFAAAFGASTVTGLASRFLLSHSSTFVDYQKVARQISSFQPKPVKIPDWAWAAKSEWGSRSKARRRLTEQVLRMALVMAGVNGDREITKECLEAAFRLGELQERTRAVYRPGVAETKEAECYGAVYDALRERLSNQKKEAFVHPKADLYTIDIKPESRWKLLHFSETVNAKSYYRKYAGLIDRARKSMVENGIIAEVCEMPEGSEKKKGRKTPFVILRGELK